LSALCPCLGEPLSQRELQVYKLKILGLSNPEIAKQLFIAERTVKAHMSNILLKKGAGTSCKLIVKYYTGEYING